MRTLVVGDVHGCADELDQILHQANADRVVLVGDLFTKGPDPAGVFALVRDHEAVLGNHDDRLLRYVDGDRPNDGGAESVVRALAATPWETWLRALPLSLSLEGFDVVHAGVNPVDPSLTSRRQHLLIRQHPPGGTHFWWQQYHGERGIVFGHDARRGLVRVERGNRPYIIGLDTGCVYGGALTGWLLEEDRFVQVPAARAYRPV